MNPVAQVVAVMGRGVVAPQTPLMLADDLGFTRGDGCFDAVRVVVGETTRVDGPYAEAKEIVGGWAILQYDTVEEAVAGQQEFADLHAKYWPEVSMVATLRQISDGPEQPAP